ncbi:hypothetical protein [Streptomyces sp. IMTB 2501]|uniref:hypothetical protein n=1 Tax=Streptomyces sp. IMTB 2501 TaxID=1776340 RepID=UPI00117C0C77|nr:hypothetical protein [Streptomyces sp. IMTB 2501]
MCAAVVTGPDWLTVDRFLSEVPSPARHSVLPVLGLAGRPSGVVRLSRLAAVPPGKQRSLRVRDVATPLSRCTLAAPQELLNTVLERLLTSGGRPSWSWTTAGSAGSSPPTTSTAPAGVPDISPPAVLQAAAPGPRQPRRPWLPPRPAAAPPMTEPRRTGAIRCELWDH